MPGVLDWTADHVIQQVTVDDEEYDITVKMCWDLICSAFEGGSNYWIDYVELHGDTKEERQAWSKKHGQRAQGIEYTSETSSLAHCMETGNYRYSHQIPFISTDGLKVFLEGGEAHLLNYESIISGIDCILRGRRHKRDWLQENWDAITADAFLQYCLFGKVVYG